MGVSRSGHLDTRHPQGGRAGRMASASRARTAVGTPSLGLSDERHEHGQASGLGLVGRPAFPEHVCA